MNTADSTPWPDDPLEREIALKEAQVARRAREIDALQYENETAKIEIRALRRAAELRPRQPHVAIAAQHTSANGHLNGHTDTKGATKRGKAPGTISNLWRQVMAKIVADGNTMVSPDRWAAIAKLHGKDISADTARNWLRRGTPMEQGYVVRDGDTYRVSDAAVQKFGFDPPSSTPRVGLGDPLAEGYSLGEPTE